MLSPCWIFAIELQKGFGLAEYRTIVIDSKRCKSYIIVYSMAKIVNTQLPP